MSGPHFDNAKASREAEEFMERVTRGLGALTSVGNVTVGTAPKDEIFREDKLVLYRYRPHDVQPAKGRIRTPLLICYALVNRPYMMDLQPDRSLIRRLLERGLDVYLIDWGYPDGADRYLAIERLRAALLAPLRCRGLPHEWQPPGESCSACVRAGRCACVTRRCIRRRVRNLITMVTPVDFHTPENLLAKWSCARRSGCAARAATGNVPGEMLNALFLGLMPFRLTSQKYVDLHGSDRRSAGARKLPAHGKVDLRQSRSAGRDVPGVHARIRARRTGLPRERSMLRASASTCGACRCRY